MKNNNTAAGDNAQAQLHLGFLLKNRPQGHFVEIRALRRTYGNAMQPAGSYWLHQESDIRDALSWAKEKSEAGAEVFISANARASRQGTKAAIEALTACFIDADTYRMAGDDLAQNKQHAITALATAALPPNLIVDSGGGAQAVWFIEPTTDKIAWSNTQRALQQTFAQFEADQSVVTDEARVMRLAGFPNRKNGESRPTGIIEVREGRYSISELTAAYKAETNCGSLIARNNKPQPVPSIIFEGSRNDFLMSIAGSMRHRNMSESAIAAALLVENETKCKPPLSEREVRAIARSAMRYEAAETVISADATNEALNIVRMSEVEAESVSWLWYPYIALGKLTIIEGDPGVGKSTALCAIASAVSTGRGLPLVEAFPPAVVLMLSAEDGIADTLRPRLDSVEADTNKIYALNEPLTLDATGLQKLETEIAKYKPALVTIDPLFAFTGGKVDIHRANECRVVSSGLADIATRFDCAIVALRHLSKSRGHGHALNAGIGSIDFTAAARSVLLVGADPDNPNNRAIVQTKNNLAPIGDGVGYSLEGGRFFWKATTDLNASRILSPASDSDEFEASYDATQFLIDFLSTPQPAKEVKAAASQAGISDRALRKARRKLNVVVKKIGQPGAEQRWEWSLPEHDHGRAEDDQDSTSDHLRLSDEEKGFTTYNLPEDDRGSLFEHLRSPTNHLRPLEEF